MTLEDVAKLLAVAAVVDNRTVDREMVMVWHDLIGHLNAEQAVEALREHRRTSTEYLQPAHIIALARKRVRRADNGIARPPAPAGKTYAVDVIEYGELE